MRITLQFYLLKNFTNIIIKYYILQKIYNLEFI